MKKNLLAIGLIGICFSTQAQVLTHVDNSAVMYVSQGTLVYNGGGLQTRGTGIIDLHGNMMVEATGTDVVKTLTTANADKTDGSNIVLRLNNPGSTATDNTSYGQLYINGIAQNAITAVVSKEFRAPRQGIGSYFQQIALPFSGKVLSSLSTEFGKTFGTTRFTQNEILNYNNPLVVSNHYTSLATTTTVPTAYYMLGSNNNNLNTATPTAASIPAPIAPTAAGSVYVINGVPYTAATATTNAVALSGAGNNINFGAAGNATNQYNEKYNTYLQDNLEVTSGTGAWGTNYGRNIYQFGNPFLTNLDLSKIGFQENATLANTDLNNVSNIWGVRYDPGTVTTLSGGSTYSTGALIQTFQTTGVPVGDIGLIVKPMQAFVIKLRNNTAQTLNFNTLRRFSDVTRNASTTYSVSAAKNTTTVPTGGNTLKQLGVIAIDASGHEIARTYYVVSPTSITGHQNNADTTVQAGNSGTNIIGTYEEALNGGYDQNYTSSYWLYINEANETNFLGKNVKLVNYDYNVNNYAVSYKFEIRENGELVNPGTHLLSAGKGFYFKAANGTLQQAVQGGVIPISNAEADLYYGEPSNIVLGTQDNVKPSRTMVIYNPEITDYIVRFDPNWKKADIQVYDMSGKLVISQKGVSTTSDFVIKLDGSVKNSYVVKIVSDSGEIVNTKIKK